MSILKPRNCSHVERGLGLGSGVDTAAWREAAWHNRGEALIAGTG